MAKNLCPHCGGSVDIHTHRLNEGLVRALFYISQHPEPVNPNNALTNVQSRNFQKLRYWGLITKHYDEDGKRVSGFWTITEVGKRFLAGARIPHSVETYRAETIRIFGEKVGPNEVDSEYMHHDDYVRYAKSGFTPR